MVRGRPQPSSRQGITDARASWRGSQRNVPFAYSRPGTWIAASVEVTPATEVTAISLYGLLDEFSDASVHGSLSEISPVFDDPRYRGRVLLSGELNTWTGWPVSEKRFQARDVNLLQRFEALGLVDRFVAKRASGRLEGCTCTFGDDCTHTAYGGIRVGPTSRTRLTTSGRLLRSPSVSSRVAPSRTATGFLSRTMRRSSPTSTCAERF